MVRGGVGLVRGGVGVGQGRSRVGQGRSRGWSGEEQGVGNVMDRKVQRAFHSPKDGAHLKKLGVWHLILAGYVC